jgi:hypothetical protein
VSEALRSRLLEAFEWSRARLLGAAVIVDQLSDDARPQLGRLHALLRASDL